MVVRATRSPFENEAGVDEMPTMSHGLGDDLGFDQFSQPGEAKTLALDAYAKKIGHYLELNLNKRAMVKLLDVSPNTLYQGPNFALTYFFNFAVCCHSTLARKLRLVPRPGAAGHWLPISPGKPGHRPHPARPTRYPCF